MSTIKFTKNVTFHPQKKGEKKVEYKIGDEVSLDKLPTKNFSNYATVVEKEKGKKVEKKEEAKTEKKSDRK